MAQPAVGADLDQPLDVDRDLLAQVAFDAALAFDDLPNAIDLFLAQLLDLLTRLDVRLSQNGQRAGAADPVNVSQGDLRAFLPR